MALLVDDAEHGLSIGIASLSKRKPKPPCSGVIASIVNGYSIFIRREHKSAGTHVFAVRYGDSRPDRSSCMANPAELAALRIASTLSLARDGEKFFPVAKRLGLRNNPSSTAPLGATASWRLPAGR